jgi:hypothetical protein
MLHVIITTLNSSKIARKSTTLPRKCLKSKFLSKKLPIYLIRAVEVNPTHTVSLYNYALFLKDIRKNTEKAREYYKLYVLWSILGS